MLKTETNTPAMGRRVRKAARVYFAIDRVLANVQTDFEHGQWWVTLRNSAQYSVCDAAGGDSIDGFCFEQVSKGDDE